MTELRRVSGECQDVTTCPGVWVDASENVIVVGAVLEPSPVPLGPGERAVRLPRRLLVDADLG